jgi:CDP-4-dehydro-6-deoxyglucose reductase
MIQLPKPQKFKARLASIEKISSKVYLERFELLEPKEITFLPGQTVMLYVAPASPEGGPGVNRSMSIASPPSQKNSITFFHDVSPMGVYSKWALSAKVGNPMEFMGPLGAFVLDRESHWKKVFVATGTGVAPFYGMAVDYLSTGGPEKMTLYWGLRHEEDIFWQKEFEELSSSHPNFRFVLTLSQPGETWQGKRGHVQDDIFSQPNLSGSDYYLCGNKKMILDIREKLKIAGVADIQVKSELFY